MRYEKKLNIEKRSREEALKLLQKDAELWQKFCLLPQKYREELILFYMGEQGLRTTYDTVFKHIFSPERNKERIEDFISSILGEPVKIVRVLQHEGIQMQEKGAFVIMDVVVQLADGRYLNVEMQKIGYRFPAERTDCYLADLVMRQYNDLKREKGRNFDFRDLSKVMSIVIMEQSSRPFRQGQDFYIHRGKVKYDSGIRLDGLFENIYVSLDTYKNIFHTRNKITDRKEAWLLFLSSTDLRDILEVCEYAPEFIPIYEEVFEFGKDVKEFVSTFSDSLRETDRNAERLMVEELQEELRQKDKSHEKELRQKDKDHEQELRQKDKDHEQELRQKDKDHEQELKELRLELAQLKSKK